MMQILKCYHYSQVKAFITLLREFTDLSPGKQDGCFTDWLTGAHYATACKDGTRYFKLFLMRKELFLQYIIMSIAGYRIYSTEEYREQVSSCPRSPIPAPGERNPEVEGQTANT